MTPSKNLYSLTIGDWSCDGHSLYRQYAVQINESLETIRAAYFKSCQQSRIKFHDGNEGNIEGANYVVVCTEYDDPELTKEAEERFRAFGIDLDNERYERSEWYGKNGFESVENFANLIMDFIKLSLPSLEYEFIEMDIKDVAKLDNFNGFWQTGFNLQFGYGLGDLFDDEGEDYHDDREEDDEE